MAQIWPLYGPNNLTLKGIHLFGMYDSPVKICAISVIHKQRYRRKSQNMALIWPQHGYYGPNNLTLNGILQIGKYDSPVKILAISGI